MEARWIVVAEAVTHRIIGDMNKPLLAAAVVLLAACSTASPLVSASPQPTDAASQATAESPGPTLCDARDRAGPCEIPEPEFTSSSCQDLAIEWADSLQTTVFGTLGGPETVDDGTLASRVNSAVDVATTKVIARLDSLGLKADCPEAEFLAAAQPHFSPGMQDRIGWVIYHMNPDGFDLWLADVKELLHKAYEGGGG